MASFLLVGGLTFNNTRNLSEIVLFMACFNDAILHWIFTVVIVGFDSIPVCVLVSFENIVR